MSSPAKKRKLNNGAKQSGAQSKGLEFFFAKQRQNDQSSSSSGTTRVPGSTFTELTDEELARKLQAEWDQEVAAGRENGTENAGSTTSPPEPANKGSPLAAVPSEAPGSKTEGKPSVPPSSTLTLQSTGMAEDAITTNIPLDESPLTFAPSEYLDALKEHWAAEGGNASYALLTRCFVLVSGTTSRIKIVDTLVNCLRLLIAGDPSSLMPAVSRRTCIMLNILSYVLGLASHELHIASLYIPRTGIGWLCDIQGSQASLRVGQ
jgi:DNA ligase-1